MATVDLDALAAELRAAGCETKRWDDDEYPSYLAVNLPVSDNPRRSIEWDVMDDGDVILYDDIQFGDKAFQSVDIIRRAVSPSAPEGLRERIAKAAFDAHSKSIDVSVHQAKWPPHRDWVVRYETEADYILDVIALAGLTVADAVLAVLPPAPPFGDSGRVVVDRARFERLRDAAEMAADEWGADSRVGLLPGDLDPL